MYNMLDTNGYFSIPPQLYLVPDGTVSKYVYLILWQKVTNCDAIDILEKIIS